MVLQIWLFFFFIYSPWPFFVLFASKKIPPKHSPRLRIFGPAVFYLKYFSRLTTICLQIKRYQQLIIPTRTSVWSGNFLGNAIANTYIIIIICVSVRVIYFDKWLFRLNSFVVYNNYTRYKRRTQITRGICDTDKLPAVSSFIHVRPRSFPKTIHNEVPFLYYEEFRDNSTVSNYQPWLPTRIHILCHLIISHKR